MSATPRPMKGVKSVVTGQIVEIVPAILVTDADVYTIVEVFDDVLRQLAKVGILPLRIVHGEVTAESLDEPTREEVREDAAKAERDKIVNELKKLFRDRFARGELAAAAAFAIAADHVLSGKAAS